MNKTPTRIYIIRLTGNQLTMVIAALGAASKWLIGAKELADKILSQATKGK